MEDMRATAPTLRANTPHQSQRFKHIHIYMKHLLHISRSPHTHPISHKIVSTEYIATCKIPKRSQHPTNIITNEELCQPNIICAFSFNRTTRSSYGCGVQCTLTVTDQQNHEYGVVTYRISIFKLF